MDVLEVFPKNCQISNLIKIFPEGPELFHADRWTESYDEASSSSFAKAPENHYPSVFKITPLHVLALVSLSSLYVFPQMKTFLKYDVNLSNSYTVRITKR
jgi:hypothetical protein